ncbi:Aste57867_13186 [Aphanomyces stellatus]|uniref:Aste57867_13186 protein n=1 Tax=Aphanomyces stellatus TaxID=120398 RepID=A0A485KY60_9STRA|nr:hypothetical protein As57867_013137 [Aphanomyces stellatus]VFT90027.1 Aste57867_13186 [Aphanomyces stellatus]
MCIILDECVVLLVLGLQAAMVLPSIAVTREIGLAVLFFYFVTAGYSTTYAFLYTLRECCPCLDAFQRHGAKLFYLLHLGLIAISVATISTLLKPYFSDFDFSEYCAANGLDHNLSNTGCRKLQGYMVLAIMALTLEVGFSIYMLLLGRRLSKKHQIEYTRLQREKALSDSELPSVQKKKGAKKGSAEVI